MTSVKTMLPKRAKLRVFVMFLLIALALFGCEMGEKLTVPVELDSSRPTKRVWAVAPFVNESGVSRVDNLRLADQFAYEIENVNGLQALPVNRVAAAMQLLQIVEVTTEAEGIALLNVLDADGLIIGTVTAYDPYPPLMLGLSVELITRDRIVRSWPGAEAGEFTDENRPHPHDLVKQAAGEPSIDGSLVYRAAEASAIFDASNHITRNALEQYTQGRTLPKSAYGKGVYDVNMDLYTRFVSYQLIGDLLSAEQRHEVAVANMSDGKINPTR